MSAPATKRLKLNNTSSLPVTPLDTAALSLTAKKESSNTTTASSSASAASSVSSDLLRNEKKFMELCAQHPNGVTNDIITKRLALSADMLGQVINSLSSKNRINILQDTSGNLVFKGIAADTAEKFKGLGPQEMLIYQLIQKEGNMGIWLRDIRRKSNLQATVVPKILKTLMQRQLIKCEKSIEGKNKKVYMLFELEPAKEVSGGSWYTGHEFDTEFISNLERACEKYLEKYNTATAERVNSYLRESGAFHVNCTNEEIEMILSGLAMDGILLKEQTEVMELMTDADGNELKHKRSRKKVAYQYRFAKQGPLVSEFTTIPCAVCPVYDKCNETGPINPRSCQYYSAWLDF